MRAATRRPERIIADSPAARFGTIFPALGFRVHF